MSKAKCPKCQTGLEIDADDCVYDDRRYAAVCAACSTHLIATASVKISYQLEIAELDPDDSGPSEYCDDSVRTRAAKQ